MSKVRPYVYGIINRRRTLKDLKIGESGYTVPWAYQPGDNLLNLEFNLYDSNRGNATMKVTRIKDEFVIFVTDDMGCKIWPR
jgi:hypothetical protein